MATDAIINLRLRLAELSDATRDALDGFLPDEASLANPVDMIASATPRDYGRALEAVLEDDGVDVVLVINVTPIISNPIDVMDEIAAVAEGHRKPVLAVMMATEDFYDETKKRSEHPPVYRFPESAARAIAHLDRYARWRRRPVEAEPPRFDVDDEAVESLLDATADGYLPDVDAFRLLDLYGIPTVETRHVESVDAAVLAADERGGSVALKAIGPDLGHKSDLGAVALGLSGATDLGRAGAAIKESLATAGVAHDGWLVQEMAGEGHEVIFGISTDPRFGPLLMFGLGGKYVEVFQDVRFGVTPLSAAEAGDMIRGIRGFALLEGVRGDAAVDLAALEETLLRLAQLAVRHPRIQELDINPFIAAPARETCKAVDVRVRVGDVSD